MSALSVFSLRLYLTAAALVASLVFSSSLLGQAVSTSPTTTKTVAKAAVGDVIQSLKGRSATKAREKVIVDTDHFSVEIVDKGAEIISFKHRDNLNKLRDNTQLVTKRPFTFLVYPYPDPARLGGANSLQYNKLVSEWIATLQSLPFSLEKREDNDSIEVRASARVEARVKGRRVPLVVTKVFHFFKKLHYWRFSWELKNLGSKNVQLEGLILSPYSHLGPELPADDARSAMSQINFYYKGDEFTKYATSDAGGGIMACYGGGGEEQEEDILIDKGDIGYIGSSSRFMLMATQPLAEAAGVFSIKRSKEVQLEMKPQVVAAGTTLSLPFIIYSGPKVHEYVKVSKKDREVFPELSKLHTELTDAFDFGITAPVRDVIVGILEMLYAVIPNYGIGIIIFALLFKLVFWPLNQKQAESMKKMQALQPFLKEINEKYKTNPQEKQKRTMALYKEHKVNPLSGCLPMLIQLPIFIALYTAFSDSYELWKSPFISGWINDLSQPDTVYTLSKSTPIIGAFNINILPILMTASQFLQTKFTTVASDANQQKMMQFMPLMMLFFFWSMPSGVVLYWTIQNLLSIAQQWYTNMKGEKAEAAA